MRKAVVDFSSSFPVFLDFQKEKIARQKGNKAIFSQYVRQAAEKFKTKKVAIASAGIVDDEKKKVYQAAKCYGREVFDFSFLTKAGWEVFLENDGRAFGWGNYVFELNRKPETVLSLVLGTGIGGGFIEQGKVWRGQHGSSLEVSHLFWGGRLEGKEVFENWENLSAGQGIEKSFLFLSGKKRKTSEIFLLAQQGDLAAQAALQTAGSYFSLGLANLINIFDPEKIVLGGSAIRNNPAFFKQAVRASRRFIFNQKINPSVHFSRLGEKANLAGVGSLMEEK